MDLIRIYVDLGRFTLIYIDLELEKQNADSTPRSSWAVFFGTAQENLGVHSGKFGNLWRPTARRSHPLYKKIRSWKLPISGRIDNSMPRAWRPLGVRRLVNDDEEQKLERFPTRSSLEELGGLS